MCLNMGMRASKHPLSSCLPSKAPRPRGSKLRPPSGSKSTRLESICPTFLSEERHLSTNSQTIEVNIIGGSGGFGPGSCGETVLSVSAEGCLVLRCCSCESLLKKEQRREAAQPGDPGSPGKMKRTNYLGDRHPSVSQVVQDAC